MQDKKLTSSISTIFILLVVSCVSNSTLAQIAISNENAIREFENLTRGFAQENQPGGTLLVSLNGKILHETAYGKANLELDVDMRNDHVFRIASVTKLFTAVAILRLVEQGKLSLDDQITKFVPDYPTEGNRITIEHLLTHTSGIHNYNDDMQAYMAMERTDYTQAEFIDLFKNQPMNFKPGSQFRYNNSAYYLLGFIIERVSGKSYEDYLHEEIFAPLKMKNTSLSGPRDLVKNRTAGYDCNSDGFLNARYESKTFYSSTGGIQSTTRDLFLFVDAMANNRLIGPDLNERACKRFKLNDGRKGRTGYGWFVGNLNGSPFIIHDGRTWGYSSSLVYFPQEKICAIQLSNCSWYGHEPHVPYGPIRLAAVLLGKEYYNADSTPPKQLEDFTGVFVSRSGEKRKILNERGDLWLVQPNGWKSKLAHLKNGVFFVEDSYETIQFEFDSKQVSRLISTIGDAVSFQRED